MMKNLAMLFSSIFILITQADPVSGKEVKTNAERWAQLERSLQWLSQNPPNGKNAIERKEYMVPIQKACNQLSPSDYLNYVYYAKDDQANQMEDTYLALRYLHTATLQAIEDIHRTQVKQGVAIWFLYNMGYVFKTPTACFGIDICGRDVERLASDLDFLLVSHEHSDHYSVPLIKAMLERKKSVVTPWFEEGTMVVSQSTHFDFGDIHIKVDLGDHPRPNGRVILESSMLMFEVDCGPSANRTVIYHSGDGNNYWKMRPEKTVDVFIAHVKAGMSLPEAVRHLKPKMTLVSHVLELGHSPTPPNAFRAPYRQAFEAIQTIPEKEATVLTWGECWVVPGTLLQEEHNKAQ